MDVNWVVRVIDGALPPHPPGKYHFAYIVNNIFFMLPSSSNILPWVPMSIAFL